MRQQRRCCLFSAARGGVRRRGEEGGGGGRRTWQSLSRLLASQCPCRPERKIWRCTDVTSAPLGVATRSDPSPCPLFFFFFWKNLASFSLRHKRNALMGATGAVRAERPRPLCAPWSASDGEGPTLGTAVRRNRSNGFGARPSYLRGFFGCTWPARTQVVCACTQRVLAAPALKSLASSLAGTARKQFGGTPREKCVRLAG